MTSTKIIYNSAENKSKEISKYYLQTHQAPYRYLAYRDIPGLMRQFVKGRRTLDLGTGTGASAKFLYDFGLDVVGIDISHNMLEQARSKFPFIDFHHVDSLKPCADFELVFSSFVLLELSSKNEIIRYLSRAISFLKRNGIFIGITGSEHLYSSSRKWLDFSANFEKNRTLHSGDIVKLALKCPEMEFNDYYWTTEDYLDCFMKSKLEILKIHSPLGYLEESYSWKDELCYSPFTLFIARKTEASLIEA